MRIGSSFPAILRKEDGDGVFRSSRVHAHSPVYLRAVVYFDLRFSTDSPVCPCSPGDTARLRLFLLSCRLDLERHEPSLRSGPRMGPLCQPIGSADRLGCFACYYVHRDHSGLLGPKGYPSGCWALVRLGAIGFVRKSPALEPHFKRPSRLALAADAERARSI